MIECNADILFSEHDKRAVKIVFPRGWEDAVQLLKQDLARKRVGQAFVKLGKPRKPRTTGADSQSHHLNGHVAQIAQEQGDEFEDVKMEIKRRAIKRGYPFRTDSFGNVVPQSEADCSTVECAMLIEEAHDVASFLGVRLREA